jgi:hypothetical protein
MYLPAGEPPRLNGAGKTFARYTFLTRHVVPCGDTTA